MRSGIRFLFFAAATLQQPVKSQTDKRCRLSKKELTERALKQYCQTSSIAEAVNKPANLSVAMINNRVYPASCLTDTEKCYQDDEVWARYIRDHRIDEVRMNECRKQCKKDLTEWREIFLEEWGRLASVLSISDTQLNEAKILGNQLYLLKRYSITVEAVTKLGLGNCDEQTRYSSIKLFQQMKEHNLKITLQHVELKKSNTKGGLIDHTFLLINSNNAHDINLKNTQETEHYLNSLEGIICDKWNNNLLIPFKKDITNFYSTGWDTIEVETIDFNFNKLKSLPTLLSAFFCQELAKMNLEKNEDKTCEQIQTEIQQQVAWIKKP